MMTSRSTRLAALLGAAALTVSLAACSSGGAAADADCADTLQLDSYSIPICGDLRLAVFLPGTNNADLQSRISYLKETIATIPGAEMTVFDGKFDATTQLNQIENAIQSGEFNAAIAAPVDGVLTCDALSKEAPAAGILVAVPNLALCGLTAEEGDALAAPGTLTYVGGTQSPDYWTDYLTWILDHHEGDPKFIALTDPPAPFPLTANFQQAVERVQKTHPDFQIVGEAATDLTVAGAFTEAEALIQAHPEATGLITMYSTITQGAVQAIQAAGDDGRIAIYDKGATQWAVDALNDGTIVSTSPERAVTSTATMLQAILDARSGEDVPRFYPNDGAPLPADAPASGFTVFTADTLGDYTAEG